MFNRPVDSVPSCVPPVTERTKVVTVPLTTVRAQQVLDYYEDGKGGAGWYAEMRRDFVQLFGSQENADLYIRLLAATSANNGVEMNVLFAFKAYALCKLGLPICQYGTDDCVRCTPDPAYRGKRVYPNFKGFMDSHYKNIVRAVQNECLSGFKVANFVDAMMGNEEAVVIDRWMIRAFGMQLRWTRTVVVELLDGRSFTGEFEELEPGGRAGFYLTSVLRSGDKDFQFTPGQEMYLSLSDLAAFQLKGRGRKQLWHFELAAQSTKIQATARRFGQGKLLFHVTSEIEGEREPEALGLFEKGEDVEFDEYQNFAAVPFDLIRSFEFKEKGLTDSEYRGYEEAVRRLAPRVSASPRDFQAAVWTGIKIAKDPSGLENFVTYYEKHYGRQPPDLALLKRVVESVQYKAPEAESGLFSENPPEDENEAMLLSAASMLQ